jgi:hypothetical protein
VKVLSRDSKMQDEAIEHAKASLYIARGRRGGGGRGAPDRGEPLLIHVDGVRAAVLSRSKHVGSTNF